MQPIDSEMAETGGAAGRRTPREPLLSIVFYFIKPAEFLNDAISTVVSQQTDETELIVVAGHSPGEELGIAPAFVSRIDRLIAEPDRGGWDAANKGWRAAQGSWIQFVMSDDRLPPGSVAQTLEALHHEEADLASGGLTFFAADGSRERPIRIVPARELTLERVLGDLCAPSLLFRRRLLQRMDGFDGRYPYAHDRELLLRAWLAGTRHARLSHEVYRMRVHAGSRTTSWNATVLLAYLNEHLAFADRLLLEPGLPPAKRRQLQRWRDEEFAKRWLLRSYARVPPSAQVPAKAARPSLPRLAGAFIRLAARRLLRAIRDPRGALARPVNSGFGPA